MVTGVPRVSEKITSRPSRVAVRSSLVWGIAPLLSTLVVALDTAHFVLPKTRDADVLTTQLRRAVTGPEFALEDANGNLSFEREPDGLVRASAEHVVDLSARPPGQPPLRVLLQSFLI